MQMLRVLVGVTLPYHPLAPDERSPPSPCIPTHAPQISVCDTNFCGLHNARGDSSSSHPSTAGRYFMLRTFFVRLSENRSLRGFAERSAIGRRVSGRFVAGTEIAYAVLFTQTVNRAGMSVSIDNLGENVTNPDEARSSAELYHQILDPIGAK